MSYLTKENISLKVAEALKRDVSRGIVRFDRKYQKQLGVEPSDIVELVGERTTAAIVANPHPDDRGLDIIRMDGYIRRNAGVSIGDYVTVSRAEVQEAKKVVLAPAQKGVFIQIPGDLVKQDILGRPVVKGDLVVASNKSETYYNGSPFDDLLRGLFEAMPPESWGLKFIVMNTVPRGVVIISKDTEIEVLSQAPETDKETISEVYYEDIGSLSDAIQKIREMVELPLKHPELFERLGIEPPTGVLLYGPPGTGKSLLARAVINESGANAVITNPYELVSILRKESPIDIVEEFSKDARELVLIEDIDSIALLSSDNRDMVVATINLLFNQFRVIGTTSNLEVIKNLKLLTNGKFEEVIELKPPNRQGRKEILQIHTRGMPLEPDYDVPTVVKVIRELMRREAQDRGCLEALLNKVEGARSSEEVRRVLKEEGELYSEIRVRLIDRMLEEIAEKTHGFVGADLAALAREAAMVVLRRLISEGKISPEHERIPPEVLLELRVRKADFYEAFEEIKRKKQLE